MYRHTTHSTTNQPNAYRGHPLPAVLGKAPAVLGAQVEGVEVLLVLLRGEVPVFFFKNKMVLMDDVVGEMGWDGRMDRVGGGDVLVGEMDGCRRVGIYTQPTDPSYTYLHTGTGTASINAAHHAPPHLWQLHVLGRLARQPADFRDDGGHVLAGEVAGGGGTAVGGVLGSMDVDVGVGGGRQCEMVGLG